jgi:hypothetical protein
VDQRLVDAIEDERDCRYEHEGDEDLIRADPAKDCAASWTPAPEIGQHQVKEPTEPSGTRRNS